MPISISLSNSALAQASSSGDKRHIFADTGRWVYINLTISLYCGGSHHVTQEYYWYKVCWVKEIRLAAEYMVHCSAAGMKRFLQGEGMVSLMA